ncbi:hypothetical protein, partial [Lawsonella clevelandensis]|uniref:hypothetical protein n=1 Tax=Lawsonella clevelandensis TaxID=1528099 RepID=UPI0023F24B65
MSGDDAMVIAGIDQIIISPGQVVSIYLASGETCTVAIEVNGRKRNPTIDPAEEIRTRIDFLKNYACATRC